MYSVCSVGKKKFNDHPFAYHTELKLEIATLTNHGAGLARVPLPPVENRDSNIENSSGWVVMVPFCLPGERVRARIFRNHKNYSEADLIEVLTPSPHRIAPPCPLFGRCGGCQYQHLAYSEQLAWKRRQVAELLQHMAGVTFEVNPIIGSPREYGYRSKITPHFNPPRDPAQPPAIGFLRLGTRFDILDVPHCPIATDAINARLPAARAEIFQRAAEGAYSRGATLLLRDAGGQVTTDYEAIITEEIAVPPSEPSPLATRHSPLGVSTASPLKLRFLARDFSLYNQFNLPAFTSYAGAQDAASGARFLV